MPLLKDDDQCPPGIISIKCHLSTSYLRPETRGNKPETCNDDTPYLSVTARYGIVMGHLYLGKGGGMMTRLTQVK